MRTDVYKSKAWKNIRRAYAIEHNCLCERCGRPVYVDGVTGFLPREKRLKYVVHHKEYLNDTNWMDDDIAYNTDNLELLCIDCHNREHYLKCVKKGYMFDDSGNIIPISDKTV